MYAATNFDTHQVIKSFVIAGLKEAQAEAIVNAIVQSKDYDLSKLATKEQLSIISQDVALLKQKIENLERTMATKEDLAKQENNILRWFITTMIAFCGIMSGIMFTMIKYIH